jgi:hypothetical protein
VHRHSPHSSVRAFRREGERDRKKVLRLLSFQRWPIQLRRLSPRRRRPWRRPQRTVLTHGRRCSCRPTPPRRRRRLPRPLLQPQRRRQGSERSGFLGRTPPCTRLLAAAKVSSFLFDFPLFSNLINHTVSALKSPPGLKRNELALFGLFHVLMLASC